MELNPQVRFLIQEDFPNLNLFSESFLLKINSKCTVSREAETLYSELAKDNFRSNYTGLCHGILNTFVGNTFLELPPSSFKNDGAGKGGDTEKERGDPEKGRNNTSETRSREISRLNFHSSEKIR